MKKPEKPTKTSKTPARSIEPVAGGPAAVKGISCSGVHCGLKPDKAPDLALFVSEQPCRVAAFYTTNKLLGAHIPVFRETLTANRNRVGCLLVNSKNANCATGEKGVKDNLAVAAALAGKLGVTPQMVLFASTGVIGDPLPKHKITAALDNLIKNLDDEDASKAASAIMTTDTKPKTASVRVRDGNTFYHIGGVAKGSGMIAPNMATMFGFIFTDASVPTGMLHSVSKKCLHGSFNSVSVDGDMSPNDTVLVMANGMSGVKIDSKEEAQTARFTKALAMVMQDLAQQVARDGEGATRLVQIEISGAISDEEAHIMARHIANSMLVKTAIFGGDPNWGRILSAAATADVELDPTRVRLTVDGVCVYNKGKIPPRPSSIMKGPEVRICLDAGIGSGTARFWTCDLSCDYVKINAEYTT